MKHSAFNLQCCLADMWQLCSIAHGIFYKMQCTWRISQPECRFHIHNNSSLIRKQSSANPKLQFLDCYLRVKLYVKFPIILNILFPVGNKLEFSFRITLYEISILWDNGLPEMFYRSMLDSCDLPRSWICQLWIHLNSKLPHNKCYQHRVKHQTLCSKCQKYKIRHTPASVAKCWLRL